MFRVKNVLTPPSSLNLRYIKIGKFKLILEIKTNPSNQ